MTRLQNSIWVWRSRSIFQKINTENQPKINFYTKIYFSELQGFIFQFGFVVTFFEFLGVGQYPDGEEEEVACRNNTTFNKTFPG